MKKLGKVLRAIDIFTKWVGYCLAPFVVILTLLVVYDISTRQVGWYTAPIFDIEWFLNGAFMTLALGYALLVGKHVRVDVLSAHYPSRVQAALSILVYIVLAIPFLTLVVIEAWDFSMFAKNMHELTVTGWEFPMWIPKFFTCLGPALLLPQCFAELIRSIFILIKSVEPEQLRRIEL